MSHGAEGEPNLTPILDMVFQLITFFMLVMNFKAAELDQSLKLPVIGSAKPLDTGNGLKLLVLNVNVVTKCPQCDGLAKLATDDNGKPVLKCEKGHETSFPQGAITNGKTAVSIYGVLYTKERRGDHKNIDDYLEEEARLSRLSQKVTAEDIESGKEELNDIIVIRADKTCPFGAVNDILTSCQKKGYRKFALKTGQPPKPEKQE